MRSDIVPGATFPDYALPDHTVDSRSDIRRHSVRFLGWSRLAAST
jgi:hypothetical protein